MNAHAPGWQVMVGTSPADATATSVDADASLVERARTDPQAFARLYRRYADPVYRYCFRRLGTREAAEDATQLIFEKALHALPTFRATGSIRGWIFAIAHNALSDHFRTSHPHRPFDDALQVVDPSASPEDLAIQAEEGRQIRALMVKLTPRERQLLELRLAGLTDYEIAESLGQSYGSVRTMQFRTVVKLRSLLAAANSTRENHHVQA
jgi:RNA polymerase sigma factor (sigma-70 family)